MKIVSILGELLYNSEKGSIKDTVVDALKSGANLFDAKNITYVPVACPSEGSFTAWKKVGRNLIELEIQADARRSYATTEKCRCDKAKVISITNIDTNEQISEIINTNHVNTLYKVGEMVYPDAFDEDRFNECTNGIHFFYRQTISNILLNHKNQTIMKNLGEYDRITQTIEIPSDVINKIKIEETAERFRKYMLTELAHRLAEKLMESGYVSETWIKKENSEECTATLYVKPLIKNN